MWPKKYPYLSDLLETALVHKLIWLKQQQSCAIKPILLVIEQLNSYSSTTKTKLSGKYNKPMRLTNPSWQIKMKKIASA